MPSTYAHFKLGKQVTRKLSEKDKKIISKNMTLYNIGLHGPDILFYYNPLFSNPTNSVGYKTHEKPGKIFFQNAIEVIRKHNYSVPYIAYCYGFICHFALDMTCHGYIDEKINSSGVTHTEIEVDFDRALMENDGLDPVRHSLTKHIIPSIDTDYVISHFFNDNITPDKIHKSLLSMKFYNGLIITPNPLKRELIYDILRATGNYKEMHGLMVPYEPNPNCIDSTQKLFELYDIAVNRAVMLIGEMSKALENDDKKKPIKLNELYRYTFGSKLID